MPRKRLEPPWRGVSNNAPFIKTPGDTCPPDAMLNVRPKRAETGRKQMGSRPGLVATFPNTLPGPVLACGVIAKSTGISGYNVAGEIDIPTVRNVDSTIYHHQFFVLDPNLSVSEAIEDDRIDPPYSDPPTGAGGPEGYFCCWNTDDDDIVYFATITYDDAATGDVEPFSVISRYSMLTHAITHQVECVQADPGWTNPLSAGYGGFLNQILHHGPYVFAVGAANHVFCYREDNLTYLNRHQNSWGVENQQARVVTVDGVDYLLVLFTGSVAVSGPVVADSSADPKEAFGEHFRTGVRCYRINYADSSTQTPVAVDADVLTEVPFPQGTQAGDGGFENHRTYRMGEYSITRPVGRLSYSFDVDPDTLHIYVGSTNQGFGYDPLLNTDQRPENHPYITISKHLIEQGFDLDGTAYIAPDSSARYGCSGDAGGWEKDTQSYRRVFTWGAGSYRTDIPPIVNFARIPSLNEYAPSAYAVQLSLDRTRVIVGGRRPTPGTASPNLHCLDALTGAPLWTQDLAGLVQQHCIAVDPTTGNIWVAAVRNFEWEGSNNQQAMLWEIDIISGSILRTFDFTDNVMVNGYIEDIPSGIFALSVNGRGQVAIAVAPFIKDT